MVLLMDLKVVLLKGHGDVQNLMMELSDLNYNHKYCYYKKMTTESIGKKLNEFSVLDM